MIKVSQHARILLPICKNKKIGNIALFNPLVPKDQDNECHNLLFPTTLLFLQILASNQSVIAILRIFIFCTLGTNNNSHTRTQFTCSHSATHTYIPLVGKKKIPG